MTFSMCFKCVLILVFFRPPPKKIDHGSVAPSGDRDRRHYTEPRLISVSDAGKSEHKTANKQAYLFAKTISQQLFHTIGDYGLINISAVSEYAVYGLKGVFVVKISLSSCSWPQPPKKSLAENPPEKNAASRKSAEKVCQPAEYKKKIRLGV